MRLRPNMDKSINLQDLSQKHLSLINDVLNELIEVHRNPKNFSYSNTEIYKEKFEKIFEIVFEFEKIAKKCSSCGEVLHSFEWQVCGPCRMQSSKFKEELGE